MKAAAIVTLRKSHNPVKAAENRSPLSLILDIVDNNIAVPAVLADEATRSSTETVDSSAVFAVLPKNIKTDATSDSEQTPDGKSS